MTDPNLDAQRLREQATSIANAFSADLITDFNPTEQPETEITNEEISADLIIKNIGEGNDLMTFVLNQILQNVAEAKRKNLTTGAIVFVLSAAQAYLIPENSDQFRMHSLNLTRALENCLAVASIQIENAIRGTHSGSLQLNEGVILVDKLLNLEQNLDLALTEIATRNSKSRRSLYQQRRGSEKLGLIREWTSMNIPEEERASIFLKLEEIWQQEKDPPLWKRFI